MVHFCTRPLIYTFLVMIYRQLMNDVKWSYGKKILKSIEYRYGFHMGYNILFPQMCILAVYGTQQ